ncbi:tape measure protein [Allopontixanthobacter sediminis]|uniref:Tape measure protein n=1 Tax=Allopontixanthobacter sediminis TaxID=1689985 RepID=A0A845AZY6_9SPHN|nr:tape measure protein [Allopontixanthobacter sediminis]MXP42992.1 tape measure protein [Allopontixanthobacter sediminis]
MEIDPVVLQLRADLDKYLSGVRGAKRTVEQQLGLQGKSAKRLESDIRRSSGTIASTLKGLAGTLAAAFTGRELVGLLDSFTRLQNNLRTTGLEGEALASVQARLFETSQRYGVELESLTSVFQKAALVQNELGASTEQILAINEITAAALKVTGSSAAEAQGALLQLGQALGSGVVRAEEFNSILEGALPLAQAAARGIDGFGGSVSKLRAAIADGQITSQEFFQGVLKGGVQTLKDAENATLTLSGGFTALTNALTVYFGEADKANGVSAALGLALGKLADNLDILIPALAVISTVLAGRFVAGAVAGGTALRALSAYASIATTSLAGTALAARGAGTALLAAFGGPVGLAITAIVLGLGYLATRSSEAEDAALAVAEAQETAAKATEKLLDATNRLSTAKGVSRQRILEEIAAEKANIQTKIASAKASLQLAQVEQARARAAFTREKASQGFVPNQGGLGGQGFSPSAGAAANNLSDANIAAAAEKAALEGLRKGLADADAIINGTNIQNITGGDPKKTPKTSGRSGPTGPSAEEIANRFNSELIGYAQQALASQISLAASAEERAELESRGVEIARRQTLNSIQADADYSQAQKDRLKAAVETLAFEEQAAIDFQRRAALEREAADLADENYRATEEAMRLQFELADTQAERKSIALEMLDLEDQYRRSILEGLIASETETEARKELARVALASLNQTAGARQEATAQRNETEAERYVRGLNQTSGQIYEALDAIKIDALEELNDGLVDAITGAKSLGDVFKNVANQIVKDLLRIAIQQAIIKPLGDALFGGGGGGGGILGSIFGRASGGPVSGGQMYRVNEGATPGNVEGFIPSGSGQIVPLGRMNAAQGGQGGSGLVRVVIEEAPGFAARVRTEAQGVAIEVTRQAAPAIIDASANETIRRSGRPRL